MSLLISEYVEGSGNNRAVELYNAGKSSINLQGHKLDVYYDGASTAGKTVDLSGVVTPGMTYVVAQSGIDGSVAANLTTGGSFFDGNDAIVLRDGAVILDSIGQVGVDPGSEWGGGVTGLQSTGDNTIRRMLHIDTGDTNPNNAFDPAREWNGFGTDDLSGLGTHQVVPRTLQPSEEEQLMLELVNLARANPSQHMKDIFDAGDPGVDTAISFFGVDRALAESQVSGLGSLAPLAWDARLARSAETHNNLSMQYDQQSHDLPDEASIGQRFTDAGYDFRNAAENTYSYANDPFYAHAGFYIDWGPTASGIQQPPGHRDTILNPVLRDIGIAYEPFTGTDTGPNVVTQHFAEPFDTSASYKLVGVVIDDRDGDDFYDIGEGKGGISISAANAAGNVIATTTTWKSGGYALALAAGDYTVTFSGISLGADQSFAVRMGAANQSLNVETGGPVGAAVAEIHSNVSFSGAFASYDDFADAIAAVGNGEAIDVTDSSAVGNVGPLTVAADNVAIRGDSLFDGSFKLASGRANIELIGATNANLVGNDLGNRLFGSSGDNSFSGLAGNDDIFGGYGNDSLNGGTGDDILRGGAGIDTYIGGPGDDIFIVGHRGDVIFETAGEGMDEVLAGVDFIQPDNVEKLTANAGATGLKLNGNGQANIISGAGGDDTIAGADGSDTMTGRGGDDAISGGDGNDEINGWAGNDTLMGGNGDDLLRAADGNDLLKGGNGDDSLWSTSGRDTLDGGGGDDTFFVRNTSASVVEASGGGRDVAYAVTDFTLDFGQEVEVIRAAADTGLTLVGNEIDNCVKGGDGADIIDGGAGNDTLIGAAGSDEFRFGANWGIDIIKDFVDGADVLNMSGAGVTSIAQLTITQTSQGTRIEGSGGDAVILSKIAATDIDRNDFTFGTLDAS